MSAIEDALDEFGASWEYDGFIFSHPESSRYVSVLDEVESDGPDRLVMLHRHSVTLELYDDGARSDAEGRRELSRILDEHNLRHTRHPSVYLKESKKAMTVYELDGFIEKGIENGKRDDPDAAERHHDRIV